MKRRETAYSIGTASKMTGVEKYKLRNWCDRQLNHIQRIRIGHNQNHRRLPPEGIHAGSGGGKRQEGSNGGKNPGKTKGAGVRDRPSEIR